MEASEIFDYIFMGWPVLAAIAAITPTPVDNAILMPLRKLVDLLAFNFGHAKNEGKK
jgi:hypothetical protein